MVTGKTALITGAARRLGAAIASELHRAGMNVVLHYRSSADAITHLHARLERERADSVQLVQADLLDAACWAPIIEQAQQRWDRLDVLVNNASSFYPTPLATASSIEWEDLLGTNLRAPFFLGQAAAPYLKQHRGCIVNMVDIHGERPRPGYPIYSIAKAGLAMLTKALAWELQPEVRVNAIAPGAILWSSQDDAQAQAETLARIPLQRLGQPEDIARLVLFLCQQGSYINGQVITVDGGRTLFM